MNKEGVMSNNKYYSIIVGFGDELYSLLGKNILEIEYFVPTALILSITKNYNYIVPAEL